ncbi:hypothetical protein A3H65_01160 [Candidatus Giovannonibacteria bacterium RIFCSPLOWO2_02_FULL_45_14]|uniref:Uncharacterized protein n=1 Tax=Candidatus Giovannonibacteria bacterium RIFCSPLOWO2_12_FULL_44_15 TaxID=1798364 RepID=A0A1F5XZU5_9BACT|nr:MAG: hypothetical protein A3C75_01340 [Candidatus Giovannonibacteria bacterium RIFCSPHIGHO2_02_FULL_44_31]OGF76370.1 MAG: hypothetical protein A3E62_00505 [Candidatus Giovannonibacteria bacterium RIFCSPHIGHO2_12_FULL_44_29]OGF90949.1 MAG: hypothetical protein A3H65_01160 [Candidatus Giovannonibacteria bacterium RIFCSPLOWO2_02_FULL_45_14]OGF93467.1 MAG: hypothetical protein A3G54_04225 [Candidatus Giovannonibacteria bacterium RIFCSPLOWO2_12_FULL_44_15]
MELTIWYWIIGVLAILALLFWLVGPPKTITIKGHIHSAEVIPYYQCSIYDHSKTLVTFTDRVDLVAEGACHSLKTAKGKTVERTLERYLGKDTVIHFKVINEKKSMAA